MQTNPDYSYVKSSSFFTDKIQIRAFLYRNYSFHLHSHDFYEINVIISGTGIHTFNNREIKVKSGDVFIIPPYIPHSYISESNLDVLHFIVTTNLIMNHYEEGKQVPGFLRLIEIEPYLRGTNDMDLYLQLPPSKLRTFLDNILLEKLLFREVIPETSPLILYTFFSVLYTFSELLHEQINKKGTTNTKHSEQIIKALEYIHTNFAENISTDVLCKLCFMSRSTFLRTFKKVCGCSPREYQLEYRVKKAIELIDAKVFPKTKIAHICGFFDLSHMEKYIRKIKSESGNIDFKQQIAEKNDCE